MVKDSLLDLVGVLRGEINRVGNGSEERVGTLGRSEISWVYKKEGVHQGFSF